MALDDEHVYVTDIPLSDDQPAARLLSAPKAGGGFSTIATIDGAGPTELSVDGENAYVIAKSEHGGLLRIALDGTSQTLLVSDGIKHQTSFAIGRSSIYLGLSWDSDGTGPRPLDDTSIGRICK
jgi:hypothetical protein